MAIVVTLPNIRRPTNQSPMNDRNPTKILRCSRGHCHDLHHLQPGNDCHCYGGDANANHAMSSDTSSRRLIDFTKRRFDSESHSHSAESDPRPALSPKPSKRNIFERPSCVPVSPVRFPSFRSIDRTLDDDLSRSATNEEEERIDFFLKVEPKSKRQERISRSTRDELILALTRPQFNRNQTLETCLGINARQEKARKWHQKSERRSSR